MDLIPAIDLRHGRVVRLVQGDDTRRTEYSDDPCAVARAYASAGVVRIHVVDLDAAFGEPAQRPLLERLVAAAGCAVQVGGGLRNQEAIEWAFAAGCDRVVATSLIDRDPATFAELCRRYPRRIVAALDIERGSLRLAGWRQDAVSPLQEVCARLRDLPIACALVTDIERDGVLGGPNLDLACDLARRCATTAILSGGVASLDDLREASERPEIEAAVVGRALYDGRVGLSAALELLAQQVPLGEGDRASVTSRSGFLKSALLRRESGGGS